MKRFDLIFGAAVVVVAGIAFAIYAATSKQGEQAVVTVNNTEVVSLPLSENTTYTVETPDGYNIVQIQDGFATVIEADCPDGLCTQYPKINETGQTIVCLPHKLIVSIVETENHSSTDEKPDAVVG